MRLQLLKSFLSRSDLQDNNQVPSEQRNSMDWMGRLSLWAKKALASGATKLRSNQANANDIPLHNSPVITQPQDQAPANSSILKNPLFLLFSIQAEKEGCAKVLRQACVEPSRLKNDKALFQFFRESYYSERKLASRFTLRTVSEIGNCKVSEIVIRFVAFTESELA